MRQFGIDISRYQKGLNFQNAKDEGVNFAIIKSSQSDFTDPEFLSHYDKAKEQGIYTGVYHYLTALSVKEAQQQAEYMIDKCLKGKTFEYPVFADIEDADIKALGKNAVDEIIKTFCQTIENAGYWAGFYCNYDFYRNYCSGSALADRYSLWLAYWGSEAPVSVQMWQFGGETNVLRSNKVAGVVCDQNFSYMDYPTLIKAKGLNGFKKQSDFSPETDNTYAVGDMVKLSANAKIWGTNDKFASWVYNAKLYVREINGSRVVISTLKSGSVTGAVDIKYLIKI